MKVESVALVLRVICISVAVVGLALSIRILILAGIN